MSMKSSSQFDERWTAVELPTAAVVAASFGTLVIFGVLDYLTGFEISFAVFYLVPVTIAAWFAGRRWGFVFACASSLSWYFAETAFGYAYSHALVPVWNAFVRLVFFGVIALLLAALRGHLKAESRLAKTDPLTGLANLRYFLEQLEHDLALAERTGDPLALAYVDLDDFKRVNDTHGHGAGDKLLQAVADRLMGATRRTDTVARLGGDEFGVILPATDLDGAKAILGKIRRSLGAPFESIEQPTCSIGAVVIRDHRETSAAILSAADRLMYTAKRGGKNAFVVEVYSTVARIPLKRSATLGEGTSEHAC